MGACYIMPDKEVVDKALADYQASVPLKSIAERFNVSPATLTVWAKKAGIPLRGRGRNPHTAPNARIAAILEMAKRVPLDEAGKQFGITKQRVSYIVKRWSEKKPPGASPFKKGDTIVWRDKYYHVIEPGIESGAVKELNTGRTILNFNWNSGGKPAVKVKGV